MKIEPAKPSAPSEVSKVAAPKHAIVANFHEVLDGLIGLPSQVRALHEHSPSTGEEPLQPQHMAETVLLDYSFPLVKEKLDKPHFEPCETPTRPIVSIPIAPLPAALTHALPQAPPPPVADALGRQSLTVSASRPESFVNLSEAEQAVTATPVKESPRNPADMRPSTPAHTSAPAYTGAMPTPLRSEGEVATSARSSSPNITSLGHTAPPVPPIPPIPPPIADASPMHAATVTGITTAAGESLVSRTDIRPSTPAHTGAPSHTVAKPSTLRTESEAMPPVAGTSPRQSSTVSAPRPESFANPREAEQTAITIAAKESPVNHADIRPSTLAHIGAPAHTGAKPSSLHSVSEAMLPVAGTPPRHSPSVSASWPESFANPREAEQAVTAKAALESLPAYTNTPAHTSGAPTHTSAPAHTGVMPSLLRSEGEATPLLRHKRPDAVVHTSPPLQETAPAIARGTVPSPPPVSAASLQALRMEIVSFVQNPSRPQVTVEIHPPEYGRVLVSGEMDPQGGVAVRLVVENSAVKEHVVLYLQRFPTPAEVEVMTREEYREHGESSGQRRREEGSRQPPRRHDKHTTEFSV